MRKIERSAIIQPLQAAHRAWFQSPVVGSKYLEFSTMTEEEFGFKMIYNMDIGTGLRFSHIEVYDQKKYVEFLLKWS